MYSNLFLFWMGCVAVAFIAICLSHDTLPGRKAKTT